MNDLISRQAAIDIVEFECGEWIGLARTIIKSLENIPQEEMERKHGKWIKADSQQYFRKHYPFFTCSECGYRKDSQKKWNYCPNCGARMDKDYE